MRFHTYKVKIKDQTYLISFATDLLERIFDYYHVPYEVVEDKEVE